MYTFPAPAERVRELYLSQYDLAAHFAPWTTRKRILNERSLVRLPKPGPGHDRICDVGCADGQFLALAAEHGWQPFGIEMNPPAAKRARERGINLFEGEFERLDDLPWGTFDVVTSWDSIEHTADPKEFADRLCRLLKPDGTLVLTTLNYPSLVWAVFRLNWSMVAEGHFTYWSRQSIARLFADRGFHIVDFESYSLGRDFVMVLDRFQRRRERTSTPAALAENAPSAGWDVHWLTLFLENSANRLFRWFGGGGAMRVTLRRAP
jgi:2-polyprenyl-3-methyl-5-hydroxy-6-metoxy-1,4-benzoquinol methylase